MADSHATYTLRKVGHTTVVHLTRPHVSELADVDALGDELLALLEAASPPDLLIDFEEVTFLSSSFLGRVIQLVKRARGMGGRLRLCGLRPRILEIFAITQVDRMVEIHPSLDDALGPQD